ncbi:glycosyltransferase [Fodinicola acaciae]|uniref:glycosyltransferase n=1 Tax=Fodinicola acaciae TaxID=2681555 RepID=UPI0013D65EFE|nr:glycosyltransferase family 2 protein [Fodinicola acaciae]
MKLVTIAALAAAAATAHTIVNARLLRRPSRQPCDARVSVLVPARDEEHRIEPCLRSLLAQTAKNLEIIVLDDGSTDRTAEVVRSLGCRLVTGEALPEGWLGKPHACHQAAKHAGDASEILIFVDADVVLAPHAVESTVDTLRSTGLDLVSPYPRQQAVSVAERLVQPLLQWSWLTFLPLRLAEQSPRPSLSAANGQFLAVRRETYERAGGHAAVKDEVIEDVALLRAIKRAGGKGVVVDGTELATCRMYAGAGDILDGYGKSLSSAFGSPLGAACVMSALAFTYVLPAAAALTGSPVGIAGYLAGVAGRVVSARATGGRVFPDAFAHPLSIAALAGLTGCSYARRGRTRWKGRPL